MVVAEDEAGLPPDWQPLSVEQGFSPGANTVTLYSVSGVSNVPGGETGNEQAALASLNRAAGAMSVPNGNYWFPSYNPERPAGILLMGRGTAGGLAALGWSKEKVKRYLWKHARVPAPALGPRFETWWIVDEAILEDPMPVAMNPEGIRIVVAGGEQSGHMTWMQVGCCPEKLTGAEIELPGNWSELLGEAERDLGPLCAVDGCPLPADRG